MAPILPPRRSQRKKKEQIRNRTAVARAIDCDHQSASSRNASVFGTAIGFPVALIMPFERKRREPGFPPNGPILGSARTYLVNPGPRDEPRSRRHCARRPTSRKCGRSISRDSRRSRLRSRPSRRGRSQRRGRWHRDVFGSRGSGKDLPGTAGQKRAGALPRKGRSR